MKIIYNLFIYLSLIICLQAVNIKVKNQQIFEQIKKIDQNQFRNIPDDNQLRLENAIRFNLKQLNTTDGAVPAAKKPDDLKIFKEGWLKLASLQFEDTEKFPDLPLNDKKWSKIEVLYGKITPENTIVSSGLKTSQDFIFRKNKNFGLAKEVPSADSFYFRVSGRNIYYTETQQDMVVLGAIQVTNIQTTTISNLNAKLCFEVENFEHDRWNLCADSEKDKKDWTCAILQSQGQSCDIPKVQNTTIKETQIVKQPIILIPLPSPICNENWNYQLRGANWQCSCVDGKEQSPILLTGAREPIRMGVEFLFRRVNVESIKLLYKENLMRMVLDESGIPKDERKGFGSLIDYDLNEYIAKEIIFHTPAEHQLGSRQAKMEVQVLFQPTAGTSLKEKAILSFIINEKAGSQNQFLDILDPLELPNMAFPKKSIKVQKRQQVSIQDIFKEQSDDEEVNVFNYYYYMGSLSSPPCSESVRWFVVDEQINYGYTAIEMIKGVLDAPAKTDLSDLSNQLAVDVYVNKNPYGNSRDPQPINHRKIYYYDKTNDKCREYQKCGKKKKKLDGHYEKVEGKTTTYIYVHGQLNSGIPGSVMVSQDEAFGNDEIIKEIEDVSKSIEHGSHKSPEDSRNQRGPGGPGGPKDKRGPEDSRDQRDQRGPGDERGSENQREPNHSSDLNEKRGPGPSSSYK